MYRTTNRDVNLGLERLKFRRKTVCAYHLQIDYVSVALYSSISVKGFLAIAIKSLKY